VEEERELVKRPRAPIKLPVPQPEDVSDSEENACLDEAVMTSHVEGESLVSEHTENQLCLKGKLLKPIAFKAGRIQYFLNKWKQITSDPFILKMVQGAEIPLEEKPEWSDGNLQNQVKGNQHSYMDEEIKKLLELEVIEISHHEMNEVISPVFLVEKPDGSFRMILNLKKFNEKVEYQHFKMENLMSATDLMTKGCFLASVDLRHAYYSVSVDQEYRKFLKFQWKGVLYQYTCFANGLSNCPRYFTKLLKPVYANLRGKGHLSAAFIDDCCLLGSTLDECQKNVQDTIHLFQSLGFVIHADKSVLTPCKKLKYLGFWLDSEKMTVTLTTEKIAKVKNSCKNLKDMKKFSIRTLAQVIGQIVSCFPAVLWGPLFYRNLDRLKTQSLKENKGDFDAVTALTKDAERELNWWINEVEHSFFPLAKTQPEIEIECDASKMGYGSVCGAHKAGGRWSIEEAKNHINVLEILAIEHGLKNFEDKILGRHVKILSDNTCAVSYISEMGGAKSKQCNDVANRIWMWCRQRNIWLSIAHIPGKMNTAADEKSRKFNDRTEWQLNPKYFKDLKKLGVPDIDLFASRLNCQLKPFVSWGRDPEAVATNAFTLFWGQWNFIYAFPPFSLALRTLTKWKQDAAEGIVILPYWPTAPWYPLMLRMLIHQPVLLPKGKRTLLLQHLPDQPHPLHRRLQLMACRLSGNPMKNKVFMETLCESFSRPGEIQLKDNTVATCRSGVNFVLKGVKIPYMFLWQLY